MQLTQLNPTHTLELTHPPTSPDILVFSELATRTNRSCTKVWSLHSCTATGKIFLCTVRRWLSCQFFSSPLNPTRVILQARLNAGRRWADVLRLGESVSIVLCRIAKQHLSEETQIESDKQPFKCWGQVHTSYLSQSSHVRHVEKNLSCGEISDF